MRTMSRSYWAVVTACNGAVALMLYVTTQPLPSLPVVSTFHPVAAVRRQALPIVGQAVQLTVPSLQIDVPIKKGSFNQQTGEWTLGGDGAYFADATVEPNNSNGNTLLYGHAVWGIFGALPDLQAGAEAKIQTDGGRVFLYRYHHAVQVVPSDMRVFETSGPPQLVLQTCSGAWDRWRSLYYFDFVKVENV